MNFDKLRPGQLKAIQINLERIRNQEHYTANILPTRYGKSDVIRLVSIIAKQQELASGALIFSPSMGLRDQMVDAEKLSAMCNRYSLDRELIEHNGVCRFRKMTSAEEYQPFSDGVLFKSATIQLATRSKENIEKFVAIAENRLYQTGKPLIAALDEAHETSEVKRRGELVEALSPYVLWLFVTATAVRTDGQRIPGFTWEAYNTVEDVMRWTWRPSERSGHHWKDTHKGSESTIRLIADHTTTFKEAWNEDPSPLTTMSRLDIDVELKWLDKQQEGKLRNCSNAEARSLITTAARNPQTIAATTAAFVARLKVRKKKHPDLQGIVFSCNDEEKLISNHHAKDIYRAIKTIAPGFRIQIITMKNDEGDEASSAKLKQFAKGDDDVVIVKQMGGVGWDNDRLKVAADLSGTRTIPSLVQRWTRVATPYGSIRTADVISIADPLTIGIWDEYISENGGDTMAPRIFDGELIDSLEVEDEEKPSREGPVITAAFAAGATDHQGNSVDDMLRAQAEQVITRIPQIANYVGLVELAQALDPAHSDSNEPVSDIPDSDAELNDLGREMKDIVKNLAQREIAYERDPSGHVERKKYWRNEAKRYVGIGLGVPFEKITSITTRRAMRDFLKGQQQ